MITKGAAVTIDYQRKQLHATNKTQALVGIGLTDIIAVATSTRATKGAKG